MVGFYSFFTTVPRGKHLVRVCLGTACYVRGGKQVLAALKDLLRIEVGETTSDRLFSLDVGRCFGACGLAPVIMIDDDVHQRVKPARLAKILDQYRETAGTAGERQRRERRMTRSSPTSKELTALRDAVRAEQAELAAAGHKQIRICMGAGCIASGALKVKAALEEELADTRHDAERVSIVGTGCLGPCSGGPALMIDDVFYENAPPAGRQGDRGRAPRPRAGGGAADAQAARRPRRGQRRRHGLLQAAEEDRAAQLRRDRPAAIEDYIARDGYQALAKVLDAEQAGGGDRDDAGLRAARPRRRRFPHLAEVEVHPRGRRRRRSTSSATPTKAIPARSWTAACWKAIRTA